MNGSLFINKTYSRGELKGLLEAVLFVNGKSISNDELQRVFESSKDEISGLIDEMNKDYLDRKSGLTILPVAGGYQLFSSPVYKDELMELFGKRNENQLPKSALETLAIIAYKQPVSKEDIDKIRGVSSSRSVNILMALKLATISGLSDDLLKSPLFVTTSRFLEYFRMKNLGDLPSITSLDMVQLSGNMGDEDFDEIEEKISAEDETDDGIFNGLKQ